MHSKVYIDTNILVDIFDEQRPYHEESLSVIKTCFENEEIDLFINSDSMTNLFYLMRGRMKCSFDKALEKLEFIENGFNVIYGDKHYFSFTLDICKKHIFKDYEDAMQYVCAIKNECTLIITNNPKDFKNSTIDVVTSHELSRIWSGI